MMQGRMVDMDSAGVKRGCMFLTVVLSIIFCALGVGFWLSTANAKKAEQVRLYRVQEQRLRQQINILQSPNIVMQQRTLGEDMDALRIRLVEVLTQQPWPEGVLDLEYEQNLLPQVLSGNRFGPVSVLRLELKLTVQNTLGLLDMIERIQQSVDTWPRETRSCELQRLPQEQLSTRCVIDFYHWSRSTDIHSGQLSEGHRKPRKRHESGIDSVGSLSAFQSAIA